MISKIIGNQEKPVSGSDPVLDPRASGIDYSGTVSGSTADNVQDAIDEDKAAIKAISDVYGAKNLAIPTNAVTSATVVFTANADGSVTATGTATGGQAIFGVDVTSKFKSGSSYILSGGIDGNKYAWLNAMNGDAYVRTLALSTGGDTEPFIVDFSDYDRLIYGCAINSGYGNCTFYPMIRDARIQNNTYVPYAMTNQELTDELEKKKMPLGLTVYACTAATGNIFERWIKFESEATCLGYTFNIDPSITKIKIKAALTAGSVQVGIMEFDGTLYDAILSGAKRHEYVHIQSAGEYTLSRTYSRACKLYIGSYGVSTSAEITIDTEFV